MRTGFRLSIVAGLILCARSADAQLIDYARLDIGPTGQRVVSGWTGVGTAAANANAMNLATTPLTSLTGDAFEIAIDNLNAAGAATGNIDWRDRGNSTSTATLAMLGEDFIKNNAGIIRVTLTGLAPGTYQFTSYHLDPDNTQSDNIQIRVTDAIGTNVLQTDTGNAGIDVPGATTAEEVNNITNAHLTDSSATFSAISNGIAPIVLLFDGSPSADDETPLNGLAIAIPEPSSMVLASLGIVGLIALARRNRR